MLSKKRRLNSPLFLLVSKKHNSFFSDHLALKIHRCSSKNNKTRMAIVVPVKINPRAVDRHLIKRRISFCLEKKLKLIPDGYFLIWSTKKNILKLDLKILEKEIKTLLSFC